MGRIRLITVAAITGAALLGTSAPASALLVAPIGGPVASVPKLGHFKLGQYVVNTTGGKFYVSEVSTNRHLARARTSSFGYTCFTDVKPVSATSTPYSLRSTTVKVYKTPCVTLGGDAKLVL